MSVLTAGTGREAIATLESTPDIAIVLMDIMMPEMDGYETMQVIRQNPSFRRLPIVALDRQGNEGRPRKMSGSRSLGISGKAGEHRAIAVDAEDVAASLSGL